MSDFDARYRLRVRFATAALQGLLSQPGAGSKVCAMGKADGISDLTRRAWEIADSMLIARPLSDAEKHKAASKKAAFRSNQAGGVVPKNRNQFSDKPEKKCSLTGCQEKHHAKGLCAEHYTQASREA